MAKSHNLISKGTCTPLRNSLDDDDDAMHKGHQPHQRPWLLVPSWSARGIFSSDRNKSRTQSIHDSENGSRKRQRRNNSKLEQLLSDEVRQCDVCARSILWTPSLEQSCFTAPNTPSAIPSSPRKAIAECLPQFIKLHIPCPSPLPCSFCTDNAGRNQWCGSLYCSKECQIQAEGVYDSNSTADEAKSAAAAASIQSFPNLLPPKLFFCQNRFSKGIELEQLNDKEHCELIKETTDSISSIEKRFQIICGCDGRDPETFLQIFGAEECALLLTTIIACTCPDWMSELMPCIVNAKDKTQTASPLHDTTSDEQTLVEEIWAMSRSHRSLCVLLQKYIDASKNAPDDCTATSNPTFPSYQLFLQCHLDIKRHCLLRVNAPTHPLVPYVTKTIISSHALSEEERDLALELLNCSWICPKSIETKMGDKTNSMHEPDIQSTILRWRKAAHFAHWVSNPTTSTKAESRRIQPHLQRSYFAYSPLMFRQMSHSCSPTLALAIPESSKNEGGVNEQSPLDSLAWLALHDIPSGDSTISKLDSLEDDAHSRSAALKQLMGQDFICLCVRCQYELAESASCDDMKCQKESTENGGGNGNLNFSCHQLKRLADLAMQQGRFDDASALYNSVLQKQPHDGDVLHARAASHLGRASSLAFADQGHCKGHFLEAQRLWGESGSIKECLIHPEIAVQVEKQRVYRTNQQESSFDVGTEGGENIYDFNFTSHLDGRCFITSDQTPIISQKECQYIIKTAEEHAAKNQKEGGNSGWTTARHYAVPTTDIPLHLLTELHSSFYQLWDEKIRPLLRRQFALISPFSSSKDSKHPYRDIFLHDVFVVRYDAARQRYLPPHYDESTHSFSIALNSDFKGGGTFIHDLDKTLAPTPGGMMSFCGGDLLHSGDPVVEGVRYIIAAFCYVDLVGSSATYHAGRHTPTECEKSRSSQSQNQSKLKELFSDDESKSEKVSRSVQEKSQSFSFGFDI
ncbi:hypothetical protein ACHAXR_005776 [Thalassiosira sp. AJA248-18]